MCEKQNLCLFLYSIKEEGEQEGECGCLLSLQLNTAHVEGTITWYHKGNDQL